MRLRCIITIVLVSIASVASAIGSEVLERPKYSPVLRQNEDWSSLAGHDLKKTGNSADPIKYVPLSDDGEAWVSFGGQARFRLEGWNNYDFNPQFNDTYLLTRIRLHADIHANQYFRFFAEMKSAFSTDRDLPGGKRPLDVDELDLQQAFADIFVPVGDSSKFTFRVGRQMLLYGVQRLVSPLDWSNTMRTWQGLEGIYNVGNWKFSGFWTQYVPVKKYEFNTAFSDEQLAGFYGTGAPGSTGLGKDIYWLYRERKELESRRHTVGGRLFGKVGGTDFDYDIEAAYQAGDVGSKDVEAFMVGSKIGYLFADTRFQPRAYIGFDYGSGDDDPNDGKIQTFNQLYPLGHLYLGYIDLIGRQNIVSGNIGTTFKPMDKLTTEVTGLFFWRATEEDALYNAGGIALRPGAPGTSKEVGQELDILLTYAHSVHTTMLFGYSHFFPGEFITQTGPDDPIDFFYVSWQYTF